MNAVSDVVNNSPVARAVALMGPTASGKTAAALAIARALPCEIISVDSALVYREMDIGTAKPNAEELASAPHHLIDIIDPRDAYSVAQFRKDAARLVQEIHARGRLPLLVGGTMMYFNALRNGLDDLPGADPALRQQLDEEAARIGVPGLHARLASVDPVTAERLAPNDSQRIQRALEIWHLTGKPMSALLAQQGPREPDFPMLAISLEPEDRAALHARIALRFDQMLAQGFIEEVEKLRARGDLHLDLPSIRCVGYRQAWEYLDGAYNYETMRERGIIATRQLAKRQITWLRSMPDRQVVDGLQAGAQETILKLTMQYLQSQQAD
ncbi:tRNA (adenosine(37)-N6)-dimethylallyltransferase MiaA [Undibacterium squillarum]|uniref:tRNA dimethylallyltransferase n=1 Tax=Undibacterium squillarum TaxID=1131567 RepID=A0ABQ2Y3B9_9BURK|nr:tRNA (adenosine(37)-N6)-dimethylallyltransferase MiaA [Undibacterium squillarum]GGX51190.1 tRNA dimethylallyltransferase [Undibacterium squillarum]